MSCESQECPRCGEPLNYVGVTDDGEFIFDLYECDAIDLCGYTEERHHQHIGSDDES